MKIKSGFAKRKIAGSNIVVPVGSVTKDFNGMITLNDSGSFFWDSMVNDTTEEEVIKKVLEEYDIDEETARRDIEKFIKMLEDNNLLEK
ncbi:MAG: PqqD family protein [Eubacteriales bacterium]|nr:PqqD family protein [Eubacteriales bacterium]